MPVVRSRMFARCSPFRVWKASGVSAFCALIGTLSACSSPTSVEPNAPEVVPVSAPATPTPAPAAVWPAFKTPSSPAHIYDETSPLYAFIYPMHGSLVSRYVLYDDGRFAIQFSSGAFGPFEYKGSYLNASGQIHFLFDDANLGGAWEATGTRDGSQIRVAYNGIMIGADFNNGVYAESATP
jgi:hypothetical protein